MTKQGKGKCKMLTKQNTHTQVSPILNLAISPLSVSTALPGTNNNTNYNIYIRWLGHPAIHHSMSNLLFIFYLIHFISNQYYIGFDWFILIYIILD
jgi:hypothetical protein